MDISNSKKYLRIDTHEMFWSGVPSYYVVTRAHPQLTLE